MPLGRHSNPKRRCACISAAPFCDIDQGLQFHHAVFLPRLLRREDHQVRFQRLIRAGEDLALILVAERLAEVAHQPVIAAAVPVEHRVCVDFGFLSYRSNGSTDAGSGVLGMPFPPFYGLLEYLTQLLIGNILNTGIKYAVDVDCQITLRPGSQVYYIR